MQRNNEEVIISRREAFRRRGNKKADEAQGWFLFNTASELDAGLNALQGKAFIMVDYNRLMADPATAVQAVADFVGNLDTVAMLTVPDSSLYRSRV